MLYIIAGVIGGPTWFIWMLFGDELIPWLHCWRRCPAHKFTKGE